jgi:hypothetical protein
VGGGDYTGSSVWLGSTRESHSQRPLRTCPRHTDVRVPSHLQPRSHRSARRARLAYCEIEFQTWTLHWRTTVPLLLQLSRAPLASTGSFLFGQSTCSSWSARLIESDMDGSSSAPSGNRRCQRTSGRSLVQGHLRVYRHRFEDEPANSIPRNLSFERRSASDTRLNDLGYRWRYSSIFAGMLASCSFVKPLVKTIFRIERVTCPQRPLSSGW